jgi:hypothetical protein
MSALQMSLGCVQLRQGAILKARQDNRPSLICRCFANWETFSLRKVLGVTRVHHQFTQCFKSKKSFAYWSESVGLLISTIPDDLLFLVRGNKEVSGRRKVGSKSWPQVLHPCWKVIMCSMPVLWSKCHFYITHIQGSLILPLSPTFGMGGCAKGQQVLPCLKSLWNLKTMAHCHFKALCDQAQSHHQPYHIPPHF